MNNVASLEWYRAKKGLPPARVFDQRPVMERVLDRYVKFNPFPNPRVKPATAFRSLASRCAKVILQLVENAGAKVDEAARFQFFAAGQRGAEFLQVRVNRVGPCEGRWEPMVFVMDPDSLVAIPLHKLSRTDEEFKSLLTLPMSPFYRLP